MNPSQTVVMELNMSLHQEHDPNEGDDKKERGYVKNNSEEVPEGREKEIGQKTLMYLL